MQKEKAMKILEFDIVYVHQLRGGIFEYYTSYFKMENLNDMQGTFNLSCF